jgi:hypothetical protein
VKPFSALPPKVLASLVAVIALFVVALLLAPVSTLLAVAAAGVAVAAGGAFVAAQARRRRASAERTEPVAGRHREAGGTPSVALPRGVPPSAWAFGVFVVAFAALVAAAAPGMYFKDGGELGGAAHVLGVPHPTGFPIFCMLGKALDLAPAGSVFFRLNVASAGMAALAAALAFLVASRLAGPARGRLATACALAAPVAFLGSHVAWLHATSTEVYALSAAGLAATLLAFVVAAQERDGQALVAGWLLVGLGAGGHVTWPAEGAIAGVVATVAALRGLHGSRARLVAASALFAALGALVVAYLPVAASRDPVMNWGDPSSWSSFVGHLTGRRIRESFAGISQVRWVAMSAHAGLVARTLWEGCGPLLPVALLGLLTVGASSAAAAVVLGVVGLADVAFAIQINPMGVRDLQTGLPATFVVAVLAAAGLARACAYARREGSAALLGGVASAGLLAIGMQWAASPAERDMTGVDAPRAIAADLLDRAPVASVAFTTSDDLSAGLLGTQAVEDARPDVLVLVKQHLSDARFVARMAIAHRVGPADDALIDEVRRRPFERGEGPREGLARAVRVAGARGPVLIEPGEASVDRELLRGLRPGFPAFGPDRSDEVEDTAAAVRRIEWHAGAADRWGREYLGGYARLLGTYLALAGRPLPAIPVLEAALALSPDDPRTLHNLALLLGDAGRRTDALRLLRRAVDLDPLYARGWRSLAKAAAAAGLADLAAEADARAGALE